VSDGEPVCENTSRKRDISIVRRGIHTNNHDLAHGVTVPRFHEQTA
jgi:hypothetical protein